MGTIQFITCVSHFNLIPSHLGDSRTCQRDKLTNSGRMKFSERTREKGADMRCRKGLGQQQVFNGYSASVISV